MDIETIQSSAHAHAVSKGFWDEYQDLIAFLSCDEQGKRFVPMIKSMMVSQKLMLMVEELAEAFQEVRDGKESLQKVFFSETGKPEGFGPEMADVVIRIGDLAEHLGINLEDRVIEKMNYNRTRPHMHGRKF